MMRELQATYLAGLPARITSLRAALAEHRAGAAKGLEALQRIAHSLRGSGATYGFPAVSEAAAGLEEAPEAELPARVEALIQVLLAPPTPADDVPVLVISNDAALCAQLREHLARPGRALRFAPTGAHGLRFAEESRPALIALELLLPDMDGRGLLARLRARGELDDVPLLAIATQGSTRLREECFSLGADQYFDKACDLSLLAGTIDAALSARLRAASTTHIQIMSRLLSRTAFEEQYERRVRARGPRRRCLVLIELGDLPHAGEGGDSVLHRIAGFLLKRVRAGDALARWGPTQLVLLAGDTQAIGAAALVQRLAASVEEELVHVAGRVYRVTLQVGLAPIDGDAPPPLDRAADRARLDLLAQQARLGVTAGSREASSTDTVLLAEDDPDFAALVKYVLGGAGMNVVHLSAGSGVVERALATPVSLVILDGKLPGLSGFEVLRRIREAPALRGVPVALLTALGHERDVVRGLELGADDYIVKPCSPSELLARVRKLVRARRVDASGGPAAGGLAGRLAGDQLAELLQMLGANGKSGRLSVSGERSVHIDLFEGQVVHAATSTGSSGAEAVQQALLALHGRFEFDPTVIVPPQRRTTRLAVGPLLLEAMRRRDEAGAP
jgi:two-component system cell cycle response regulator